MTDTITGAEILPPITEKKKRGRKKKSETAANPNVVAPPKKKNYLNNADLMKELAKSREQDKMTDELAKMLMMLCNKYAKHSDYISIYSYDDDMKAFALLTVCKVWRSFNPAKTNNPFAYFTQILRHAFYQYLNHETRQRTIKDELLISIGEEPSFTYMENFRDNGEFDMGTEVVTRNYEEKSESHDDDNDDE